MNPSHPQPPPPIRHHPHATAISLSLSPTLQPKEIIPKIYSTHAPTMIFNFLFQSPCR